MIELNHSLKACEMPEDDFVYLAEDVEALIEEIDKRIVELERELLNNIKDAQLNNPILKLVHVCEELTDTDGEMLCFNDLSYTPTSKGEQDND